MRRMIAAGPLAKRPPHIAFAGGRIGTARARLGRDGLRSGHGRRRVRASSGRLAAAIAPRRGRGRRRRPARRHKLGEFIPEHAAAASARRSRLPMPTASRSRSAISRASRSSSICGRRGASPASRRCPRSIGCKPSSAASSTVRRSPRTAAAPSGVEPFVAKLGLAKLKIYLDPKTGARPRLRRARAADQHRHRRRGPGGRAGRGRRRLGFGDDDGALKPLLEGAPWCDSAVKKVAR